MEKSENAQADRRLAHFKATAREAGIKLTHQRLEIFREIASTLEHPDADTVFRAVQQRMPTVSLDTVYRTLWTLHDLGLITTLGPRREGVRFDANLDRHHHYVCVRCGLVRDFESAALDGLPVPAAKRFGSVVDTHIEVRGTCHTCARERAAEPTPHGRKQPRTRRNKP